ncbi:MAG: 30S ribosomal protein S16 [Pseudobdellovibrionaceae bacterium]|jgi:small subunit ribosomal protein S16
MAVVIRLSRVGTKHVPKYRITVADSRRYVTSKHLDVLGYYNPSPQGQDKKVVIDMEKFNDWVKKGALPSDRVRSVVRIAQAATK